MRPELQRRRVLALLADGPRSLAEIEHALDTWAAGAVRAALRAGEVAREPDGTLALRLSVAAARQLRLDANRARRRADRRAAPLTAPLSHRTRPCKFQEMTMNTNQNPTPTPTKLPYLTAEQRDARMRERVLHALATITAACAAFGREGRTYYGPPSTPAVNRTLARSILGGAGLTAITEAEVYAVEVMAAQILMSSEREPG